MMCNGRPSDEKTLGPTLRERFTAYRAEQRDQSPPEPLPEPGPYHDPYHPDDLRKAADNMRAEYEREEDDRDR